MSLSIRYAKNGIASNEPSARLILWELLLHLLPTDRSKWNIVLEDRRKCYWGWVHQTFDHLQIPWLQMQFSNETTVLHYGLDDDSLMKIIHGDIYRFPDNDFLLLNIAQDKTEVQIHKRRIERILYIFSIFNGFYSYTQGFHELVFPLYYVSILACRSSEDSDDEAETHTFFLLQNFLIWTSLGDLSTMDKDYSSVVSKFNIIPTMLKLVDPQLYTHIFTHLSAVSIEFSYSWVSLMFSQLFDIHSLLYLWDFFLMQQDHYIEYGMAVVVAHLVIAREQLFKTDISILLDTLQQFRDFDVNKVISTAENICIKYLNNTKK